MASMNKILLKASPKKILSLKTLCTNRVLLCDKFLKNLSRTRQPILGSHVCFYSSDTNNAAQILSHSTLIFQDGIDIEELPIIIKRVTNNSFLFSSHTYSGGKFDEESEFDTTFRQDLHNCYSVNDIFKLLEVPSEKVRGLSASHALQRLHVLKYLNTDWNQIHSFIRSAVMKELYDTVQRDVTHLPNSKLISLVECYLAAEGFSPFCIDAINLEIQSRLGDEMFSIEELLNLAHILKASKETEVKHSPLFMGGKYSTVNLLSENSSRLLSNDDNDQAVKVEQFDKFSSKISPQVREEIRAKCSQVLHNVWIHLTSRYSDLDQHTLPLVLEAVTSDNKNITSLLQKPLARCWTDLSVEGVGLILQNLVRLRANNTDILVFLGRWAYVNIHQMTTSLLLLFLNTFIHMNFLNENLIKVMERCLSLRGLSVQTDVIAMSVEYCRSCTYLSPLVMDSAANHFTHYAYSYEPLQLFAVLRAFGQLNYLPNKPSPFLKQVESVLWDRFDHMQEVQLLEILGSFTFVGIPPKNFYRRVCDDHYFARIKSLSKHPKTVSLHWLAVLKNALDFSTKQSPEAYFQYLHHGNKGSYIYFYQNSTWTIVNIIENIMNELLGRNFFHQVPVFGCWAVYLDGDGHLLKITRKQPGGIEIHGEIAKKLAILLRKSDHFIVNTKQLIGAQAQRLTYLTEIGFTPIEIRTSHFLYLERETNLGGRDLLKSYLKPHINFEEMTSAATVDLGQDSSTFWNKLGIDTGNLDVENRDNFLSTLSNIKIKEGVTVQESGLLGGQDDTEKNKDEPE